MPITCKLLHSDFLESGRRLPFMFHEKVCSQTCFSKTLNDPKVPNRQMMRIFRQKTFILTECLCNHIFIRNLNSTIFSSDVPDYRKYGVPTIRTDLPAPRIRRVDDRKNYGDESDAYGLVNPSLFSTHGVYEKDFLLPRSREEV